MIEAISPSPQIRSSTSLEASVNLWIHKVQKKQSDKNTSENTQKKDKQTDATGLRLSPEQKQQVEELKKRDQEVRTHEQAHMAAGGDLASPASYTTIKGPDNKSYATGGEVSIDVSPVENNPSKTIDKARRIRSAALAPANPSSQDLQVAAQASQMEAQANIDKKKQPQQGSNKENAPLNTNETHHTQSVHYSKQSKGIAQLYSHNNETISSETHTFSIAL